MMRCRPAKWRKNVTVCIAAACRHEGSPRIVLGADWKQETYLAGSETADKLRRLPKNWVALIADDLSRAEELTAQYETHLESWGHELRDDLDLFTEMKKPAHAQKAALVDQYVRQSLGISYAEFMANADRMPAEFVTEKLYEIQKIKLGAALILAGFVGLKNVEGTEPYIFVVEDQSDHQDVVRIEDGFAVIGSGSYVAIPALHQRGHDSDKTLMETIYAVYEAKNLSEIVPGVGEVTSIDVMEPGGKIWSLSDEGHRRCEKLFAQLGPKLKLTEKRMGTLFAFEPSYLEPFEEEEDKAKGAGA